MYVSFFYSVVPAELSSTLLFLSTFFFSTTHNFDSALCPSQSSSRIQHLYVANIKIQFLTTVFALV